MHKISERTCKHYNGRELMRDGVELCKAGVNPVFLATGGDRKGWVPKAPCFERYGFSAKCDKCEFPSQEEMDAEKKERKTTIEYTLEIIKSIPANSRGSHGQVECPKCKGIVDWSRAKSNGHRLAKCRTDKCIFFME